MFSTGPYPLVVSSYTLWNKVGYPLTCRKHADLNVCLLFDLHGVFQEGNAGVERDLPVLHNAVTTLQT